MLDTRAPISDETVKIYIVNTRWGVRLQTLNEQTPGSISSVYKRSFCKPYWSILKKTRPDFGD
jgi:hypothetical protein